MGTCNLKVSGNPKDVVTFFDKLNCIGLDSRATPLEGEKGEGYLSCPCEDILFNPFSSEDENNIAELSTSLGCIVEIWTCVESPYPLFSFCGAPVCTEFFQHHSLIVCGRFVNAETHGKRKYDLKPFQKVARTDSEAVVLLNDLCSKDFTLKEFNSAGLLETGGFENFGDFVSADDAYIAYMKLEKIAFTHISSSLPFLERAALLSKEEDTSFLTRTEREYHNLRKRERLWRV